MKSINKGYPELLEFFDQLKEAGILPANGCTRCVIDMDCTSVKVITECDVYDTKGDLRLNATGDAILSVMKKFKLVPIEEEE